MHGITGRMGLNQHLVRSIVAIRREGGVALQNGDRVMPGPILVGRNPERVAAIAREYGTERSTGDLDAALKNPADTVFFDAATTQMRADLITRAIEAGKHIYCEKPISDSLAKALAAARLAKSRGIKHDMLCHWRYVLDHVFAPVKAVSCMGATHIPSRVDEQGRSYAADVDDAAYASFELEGGAIAHINCSWCVRVRRDDLVTFQADGTHGS